MRQGVAEGCEEKGFGYGVKKEINNQSIDETKDRLNQ